MAKTYTIVVQDTESVKLIDDAIKASGGAPEKILHRGAYDYLYRKFHQEKRNKEIKEAMAFMKANKKK